MDYSLSDDDIRKCLNGKTNIILYSELHKVKDINDLISPYNNCVILYEHSPANGHWAVLTLNKHKNKLEYFNSFGMMPDDFLLTIPDQNRKELHEDYPYLSKLMLNSPYNLEFNETPLQKDTPSIAPCGRWVCARVLNANMPLHKFVKSFLGKDKKPDEIVYNLTKNLF